MKTLKQNLCLCCGERRKDLAFVQPTRCRPLVNTLTQSYVAFIAGILYTNLLTAKRETDQHSQDHLLAFLDLRGINDLGLAFSSFFSCTLHPYIQFSVELSKLVGTRSGLFLRAVARESLNNFESFRLGYSPNQSTCGSATAYVQSLLTV